MNFCLLKTKFISELDILMSCKKNHHKNDATNKSLKNQISKEKRDVVERFLNILWKREVDFKLTTK